MKRRLAGVALLVLAAMPSVVTANTHAGAFHGPRHGWDRSTSGNWSGYDVTGSGATDVQGTWTQPKANCSPGENSWSSPWVGIDGDTSNTVEQIGTDTDCTNGTPTYYAWYEMYPRGVVKINVPVRAGDSFTGHVTYSGGNFVLSLINNTAGTPAFTTTQALKRAHLASAEWIMEGQANGVLTNFGTVSFTKVSATVNGATGDLGSLSPLNPITMVVSGVTRATPFQVNASSFGVTWNHS